MSRCRFGRKFYPSITVRTLGKIQAFHRLGCHAPNEMASSTLHAQPKVKRTSGEAQEESKSSKDIGRRALSFAKDADRANSSKIPIVSVMCFNQSEHSQILGTAIYQCNHFIWRLMLYATTHLHPVIVVGVEDVLLPSCVTALTVIAPD